MNWRWILDPINNFSFVVGNAADLVVNALTGLPFVDVSKTNVGFALLFQHLEAGAGSDRVPPIVTSPAGTEYRDLRDPSGTWRRVPDGDPVSADRQRELSDQWDAARREFESRVPKDLPPLYFPLPRPSGAAGICRNPNSPISTPPTYRVVYVDPLAIDLDGDGLETIGIDGAYPVVFDHDGDRIKTGTGWIAPDDAWLVRDLNGNGRIDSGAEMFGDQTLLANGTKASNGLSALKALDSNADGKIDANDAAFSELKIWQDLNQNGVSDAGELRTLTQAGLAQISLSPSQPTFTTGVNVAGGLYMANQVVKVTRTDGSTTSAYDLSAKHDGFYSEFMDPIEVPAELQGLPNLAGMGRLRSLQEAAVLNPALADLLAQYANGATRPDHSGGVLLRQRGQPPHQPGSSRLRRRQCAQRRGVCCNCAAIASRS